MKVVYGAETPARGILKAMYTWLGCWIMANMWSYQKAQCHTERILGLSILGTAVWWPIASFILLLFSNFIVYVVICGSFCFHWNHPLWSSHIFPGLVWLPKLTRRRHPYLFHAAYGFCRSRFYLSERGREQQNHETSHAILSRKPAARLGEVLFANKVS